MLRGEWSAWRFGRSEDTGYQASKHLLGKTW